MGFAIGFLSMSTFKAPLAGICRVYVDYRDACPVCFVCDVLAKLCKSPIAVSGSILSALNPCPLANVRQIFQRNGPLRAFGFLNESLANLMIDVFLETALPPRQFLQFAFGRACAHLLQFATQTLMSSAAAFNCFTGMHISIACDGDVGHTQVNAQRAFNLLFFRVGNITNRQQKEHTLEVHQIGFTLAKLQIMLLAFTRAIVHALATRCRPDRDDLIVIFPTEDTIIVGDCAMRFEEVFRFSIQLVGIGCFGSTAHHHLSRQTRFLSNVMVKRLVQIVLAKNPIIPGVLANAIANSISRLKRLQEFGCLFLGRIEAHLRHQFHSCDGSTGFRIIQDLRGEKALSSHRTSLWVSPRQDS